MAVLPATDAAPAGGRRAALVLPLASLILAASSAVLVVAGDAVVALRSDAADSAFLALTITGWMLLVWAVLLTAAIVVSIAKRLASRAQVTGLESAIVLGAVAISLLVVATHPLWGSGSATA